MLPNLNIYTDTAVGEWLQQNLKSYPIVNFKIGVLIVNTLFALALKPSDRKLFIISESHNATICLNGYLIFILHIHNYQTVYFVRNVEHVEQFDFTPLK
jgi:hypothetical protein